MLIRNTLEHKLRYAFGNSWLSTGSTPSRLIRPTELICTPTINVYPPFAFAVIHLGTHVQSPPGQGSSAVACILIEAG